MRYRLRISVLEPPGVNGTPTPSATILPGTRILDRTDELHPVRVAVLTDPTSPGWMVQMQNATTGAPLVIAPTETEAEARAEAARWNVREGSKLRRMILTLDVPGTSTPSQLRTAAEALRSSIETGGRSWHGASATSVPEAATANWGLWLLLLLGGAYYAKRSGALGGLGDWVTGAHFPEFKTKALAEAWARKHLSDRPWKVMSFERWGPRPRTLWKAYVHSRG